MMRGRFWTPEEDDRLKQLVREGHSYSAIGKFLGRTKNSCIGRASRIGIASQAPSRPANPKPVVRKLPVKLPVIERSKPVPIFCESVEPEAHGSLHMRRLSFDELRPNVCRFPLGEGRDMVFCGADTPIGSSWCPHHRRIAFVPYRPSKAILEAKKRKAA